MYSDADPLGEEDLTITAIGKGTSSKAGSVKDNIQRGYPDCH